MMFLNTSIESIALVLAGSFLPIFIWLWFWLKEDENPEPWRLLMIAFIGGILVIPAALLLELSWCEVAPALLGIHDSAKSCTDIHSARLGFALLIGFAFIEEYVKFLAVYMLIFWRKEYDEPVDAMIYMVVSALGFAAAENILYLYKPFTTSMLHGFTITQMRFLGPALLHALSSALLGYFIAGSFFRSRIRKETAVVLGLFFSTTLHALFNVSILVTEGKSIEPALILLVVSGIVILFSFEHIKHRIRIYYAKR